MQRFRFEDTRTPIERRVFRHSFELIVVWAVIEPWLAAPLPALRLQSSEEKAYAVAVLPMLIGARSRISLEESQGLQAERNHISSSQEKTFS